MKNFSGFTLFEVLLVLAITASVTVAGTIGLSQLQAIFRLREAGDEIRGLIQLGREYTLANKDSATYSVSFGPGVIKLMKNSNEVSRYQVSSGIVLSPTTASWSFSPITGKLGSCAPCTITLSTLGSSEIITISENGMVF